MSRVADRLCVPQRVQCGGQFAVFDFDFDHRHGASLLCTLAELFVLAPCNRPVMKKGMKTVYVCVCDHVLSNNTSLLGAGV